MMRMVTGGDGGGGTYDDKGSDTNQRQIVKLQRDWCWQHPYERLGC